jgi:hypothetical protein
MKTFLDIISTIIFVVLLGYGIFFLASIDENERKGQKAACIASGGQYAESQRHNAGPASDYCIKGK